MPSETCASSATRAQKRIRGIDVHPASLLAQLRTESPRDRGERSHPFTPGRFHVLLNSLSKVLFNFPSRYLSTIGLVPVFSLGWSLPPDLGCVPKQPDSWIEGRRSLSAPNGPGTRRGRPRSRELRTTRDKTNGCLRPVRHTSRSLLLATGFGVGLLPVHSPLLRESRLVSFPPLSDMLKFSGSSRPSRGRWFGKIAVACGKSPKTASRYSLVRAAVRLARNARGLTQRAKRAGVQNAAANGRTVAWSARGPQSTVRRVFSDDTSDALLCSRSRRERPRGLQSGRRRRELLRRPGSHRA